MAVNDFKAKVLRVNQIINSGSTSTAPLLVYGLGSATDASGSFTSAHFAGTGSDVWMFISGTAGSRNSANRGTVAFGGDVVVSGALYNAAGAAYSTGSGLSAFFGSGLFGDGYDGDLTVTGTTTLTRETYYNNLTIGATGVLKPAGFRCFVKGTLTIDSGGSFNDDGNNGSGVTAGPALGARGTLNALSGIGGTGFNGNGIGGGGGAATNSSLNNVGVAPNGGAGGAGTPNAGGLGGIASTATQGQRWHGTAWLLMGRFNNGIAQAFWGGGAGGGGGSANTAGTSGGGGGSGGGLVWIAAKNVVNNGRISTNGGNGGNAAGAAVGGGGGGGGGGCVLLVTTSQAHGTLQALGGLGGTPVTTGGAGTAGTAGSVHVVVLS